MIKACFSKAKALNLCNTKTSFGTLFTYSPLKRSKVILDGQEECILDHNLEHNTYRISDLSSKFLKSH